MKKIWPFWKANSKILLAAFFLTLTTVGIIFFRLSLYVSHPDLSLEEYYKCVFLKRIKGRGPFIATKGGVCMRNDVCRFLSEKKVNIDCKDMGNGGGWKVVRGLSHKNFDFWTVCQGWVISIGDNSYFWSKKGNGRFFEVDRDSFECLGEDQYKDKNGLIIKNTRIK